MSTFRRSAGVGTLVLSLLGLLLCIGGAVGVCVGKSHLDTAGAALFGAADEALDFMQTRLETVKQTLDASRDRVGALSKLAERVKATGEVVSEELEPLLLTIDNAFSELKEAEHWLESSQVIARTVNTMSRTIVASQDESAGVTASKVAEFSAAVVDVLARVAALRRELLEMREKRELRRELAARLISRAADLDGKLALVSARIGTFREEVSAARTTAADLQRSTERWITFAAVTLVLVLLWFAISQIGMMTHGWRLVRAPALSIASG